MSRLRKDQAEDIAHALGGTLDSYLEDEYGGAEVTDPDTFLRELAATLRKTVTGVQTKPITAAMFDLTPLDRAMKKRGRR